jgi:hypothetical protein
MFRFFFFSSRAIFTLLRRRTEAVDRVWNKVPYRMHMGGGRRGRHRIGLREAAVCTVEDL